MAGKTADEEALGNLHGRLAKVMADTLDNMDIADPNASVLQAIRQFLRDNKIECDGEKNPQMVDLSNKTLPFGDGPDGLRESEDGSKATGTDGRTKPK